MEQSTLTNMKKAFSSLIVFLLVVICARSQTYTNWPAYVSPVATPFSANLLLTSTNASQFLANIGGSNTNVNLTNATIVTGQSIATTNLAVYNSAWLNNSNVSITFPTTWLIPDMNNSNSPYGLAAASSYVSQGSDSGEPWHGFSSQQIYWYSSNTTNAQWLKFAFTNTVYITGAAHSFTSYGGNPVGGGSVTLQTSMDNTNWTSIAYGLNYTNIGPGYTNNANFYQFSGFPTIPSPANFVRAYFTTTNNITLRGGFQCYGNPYTRFYSWNKIDFVASNGITVNGLPITGGSLTPPVSIDSANVYTNIYGGETTVLGDNVQEGFNTFATGNSSHSEGSGTLASGNASHVEGAGNTASGDESHADGYITLASGKRSHASGSYANAVNDNTYVWSDGEPFSSATNNQFLIQSANGVGINTNDAGNNALRVNGNVDASGFSINGNPIGNSANSYLVNKNGYGTNETFFGTNQISGTYFSQPVTVLITTNRDNGTNTIFVTIAALSATPPCNGDSGVSGNMGYQGNGTYYGLLNGRPYDISKQSGIWYLGNYPDGIATSSNLAGIWTPINCGLGTTVALVTNATTSTNYTYGTSATVAIATNSAGTNSLEVFGWVDSTKGFTVNGQPISGSGATLNQVTNVVHDYGSVLFDTNGAAAAVQDKIIPASVPFNNYNQHGWRRTLNKIASQQQAKIEFEGTGLSEMGMWHGIITNNPWLPVAGSSILSPLPLCSYSWSNALSGTNIGLLKDTNWWAHYFILTNGAAIWPQTFTNLNSWGGFNTVEIDYIAQTNGGSIQVLTNNGSGIYTPMTSFSTKGAAWTGASIYFTNDFWTNISANAGWYYSSSNAYIYTYLSSTAALAPVEFLCTNSSTNFIINVWGWNSYKGGLILGGQSANGSHSDNFVSIPIEVRGPIYSNWNADMFVWESVQDLTYSNSLVQWISFYTNLNADVVLCGDYPTAAASNLTNNLFMRSLAVGMTASGANVSYFDGYGLFGSLTNAYNNGYCGTNQLAGDPHYYASGFSRYSHGLNQFLDLQPAMNLPAADYVPYGWFYGMVGSVIANVTVDAAGNGFLDPTGGSASTYINSHRGSYIQFGNGSGATVAQFSSDGHGNLAAGKITWDSNGVLSGNGSGLTNLTGVTGPTNWPASAITNAPWQGGSAALTNLANGNGSGLTNLVGPMIYGNTNQTNYFQVVPGGIVLSNNAGQSLTMLGTASSYQTIQAGGGGLTISSGGRLNLNDGGGSGVLLQSYAQFDGTQCLLNSQFTAASTKPATITGPLVCSSNLIVKLTLTVTNGVIYPNKASAPAFSVIAATNTLFEWSSNNVPPTLWLQYYDAATNLQTKATR